MMHSANCMAQGFNCYPNLIYNLVNSQKIDPAQDMAMAVIVYLRTIYVEIH
jgi:hypothetical protein